MRLVDGAKGIVFSEALAAEGAVVFAKACDLDLEGIASKRAGSFYKSGPSRNSGRDVLSYLTIEWTDDRHGDAEERFVTVGMVEGRLLFVVYTLRGECIRIISAREAEPRERRRYHNENET